MKFVKENITKVFSPKHKGVLNMWSDRCSHSIGEILEQCMNILNHYIVHFNICFNFTCQFYLNKAEKTLLS